MELDKGGFGPVYRGRLGEKDVAIKVLSEENRQTTNAQKRKDVQGMFDAEVSQVEINGIAI
jgi:tRNA G26 N,N-dimethylase Trm1